jgi:putative membrane protein
MKIRVCILTMVVLSYACSKSDDTTITSEMDRSFILQASMGNKAEIDAGQTASAKATDAGIKSFGQMMVTDHSDALSKLKTVAGSLGAYAPDSLDAEHVALKNQLASATGRAFDSIYIWAQVKDHQKTIVLFETEISSGNHTEVVAYANNTLPHLRHHLQQADSLSKKYPR